VSPAEMAERRKQGLCYYCDEKYSPRHKCKEPKLFQIDATDHNSSEEAPPLEEPEELATCFGRDFFSPNTQNQRFY